SLACLMLRQGDEVGLVTFGAQVQRYIPPRGGVQHMHALASHLEATHPQGETHLDQVLRELAGKLSRRGMIIIISDLFDDPEVIMRALRYFRHRRNEVIVFHILDKNELEFPFQRLTVFEDIEDTAVRVLPDPAAIRPAYLQQVEAFLAAYQSA